MGSLSGELADCGSEPHYSECVWCNQVQPFHYGPGKIYDLIIVQIAQVHCNQATRVFAAPLGRGVKSHGAEPGGTARMC